MTHIETAQQALELLEKAVATRGEDYVYPKRPSINNDPTPTCLYAYQGKPDCLIGVALSIAGWTIEELVALEDHGVRYAPALAANVSDAARLVFQAAQNVQDGGSTWGAALDNARDEVESLAT